MENPRPSALAHPEVSVTALLQAVRRHSWQLLLAMAVVAGSVYAFCETLPQFYSYTVLIEKPELGPLAGGLGGMAPEGSIGKETSAQAFFGGFISGLEKELKSYVDFKYVDRPRSLSDPSPFVKSIQNEWSPDHFRLFVYGLTPEEAKRFAEQVLGDLQTHYAPQVEGVRQDAERNKQLRQKQLQEVTETLDKLRKKKSRSDSDAAMITQEAELRAMKINLETSIAQLEFAVGDRLLHNVRVLDMHPEKDHAVWPRTWLVTGIAAALTFVLFLNFLVFLTLQRAATPEPSSRKNSDEEPAVYTKFGT